MRRLLDFAKNDSNPWYYLSLSEGLYWSRRKSAFSHEKTPKIPAEGIPSGE
jgi:hypothetical protein